MGLINFRPPLHPNTFGNIYNQKPETNTPHCQLKSHTLFNQPLTRDMATVGEADDGLARVPKPAVTKNEPRHQALFLLVDE